MTERTPPGRVSLAKVTINYAARSSKSRIVEAGYHPHHSAQDCSHTAPYAMIRECAPTRAYVRQRTDATIQLMPNGTRSPVGDFHVHWRRHTWLYSRHSIDRVFCSQSLEHPVLIGNPNSLVWWLSIVVAYLNSLASKCFGARKCIGAPNVAGRNNA